MSVTVADLMMERVDAAAPKVGARALVGAVEAVIKEKYPHWTYGDVLDLLSGLDTPVVRGLIACWRKHEEFQRFAAGDGRPASSGVVVLSEYETEAYWEVAPRIAGEELSHPRLVARLVVRIEAGEVHVSDGRIMALKAGSLGYEGELRVKGAPEALTKVRGTYELPEDRLDFGDGFPIRPRVTPPS